MPMTCALIVIDVIFSDPQRLGRKICETLAILMIIAFALVVTKYGFDLWLQATLSVIQPILYFAQMVNACVNLDWVWAGPAGLVELARIWLAGLPEKAEKGYKMEPFNPWFSYILTDHPHSCGFCAGGIGDDAFGHKGLPLVAVPQRLYGTLDSQLLAVPMFLLMSNILLKGGVGRDLFAAVQSWVGHGPVG